MTSGPSSQDGFQRALDDLVDDAVTLLEGRMTRAVSSQASAWSGSFSEELIEAELKFTYILNVPGYREDQLNVSLLGGELVVASPDFTVRKRLHASVDCSSLASRYVNGVLSAEVLKTF